MRNRSMVVLVAGTIGFKIIVQPVYPRQHFLNCLQAKAKKVAIVTAETSEDVAAAVSLLGEEVRAGFKRTAKQL